MDYGVGDWVVCVRGFHGYLKEGGKYCVSRIWKRGELLPTGRISDLACSLYGVPNMTPITGRLFAWHHSRFRKYNPTSPEIIAKHTERPKLIKFVVGPDGHTCTGDLPF